MGFSGECSRPSCDKRMEENGSECLHDRTEPTRVSGDVTKDDPLITQIYSEFDLAVSSLRRKLGKELEQLTAMQRQLFAEQAKEREVKERVALLHLERDALLIDLSELRSHRNRISAANEERAAVFQTIHRSLEKVVNRVGPPKFRRRSRFESLVDISRKAATKEKNWRRFRRRTTEYAHPGDTERVGIYLRVIHAQTKHLLEECPGLTQETTSTSTRQLQASVHVLTHPCPPSVYRTPAGAVTALLVLSHRSPTPRSHLFQSETSYLMELPLRGSATEPALHHGSQASPDSGCGGGAEKGLHVNTIKNRTGRLPDKQSQDSTSALGCCKRSIEAASPEVSDPDTKKQLGVAEDRLGAKGFGEAEVEACRDLLVAQQIHVNPSPLAGNACTLAGSYQPQVFSLSTENSRKDTLTDRATSSLDIYEIDWQTLDFGSPFANEIRANGTSGSPAAADSLGCGLHWEEKVQTQRRRGRTFERRTFGRCAPGPHTCASLETPLASICGGASVQKNPPYRARASCATSSPPASNRGVTNSRGSGNPAVVRSASWEPVRIPHKKALRASSYNAAKRRRSSSPNESETVNRTQNSAESDSYLQTDPSLTTRAPPIIFPCRAWALPISHSFRRLTTVNCSGTAVEAEALQALGALVCLKHLVLAGCNLKNLGFLEGFAGVVPLQSLIVPFNKIDALPFVGCSQPYFASIRGDIEPGSTVVQTGRARHVVDAPSPAAVPEKQLGPRTNCRNHLPIASADWGVSSWISISSTGELPRTQGRQVYHDGKQEQVSKQDLFSNTKQEQRKGPPAKDRLAEVVDAGKGAGGAHNGKHVGKPPGEIREEEVVRGRSSKTALRSSELGRRKLAGTEDAFPTSLRLFDLSYNHLSDARELLAFSSQFEQLRVLKVAGNCFDGGSSGLLAYVARVVQLRHIHFDCSNQLVKNDREHAPTVDRPGSSSIPVTWLTAPRGKSIVPPDSPHWPTLAYAGDCGRKDASPPVPCPSAASECERLQELVKRLAREKAELAEELERARRRASSAASVESSGSPIFHCAHGNGCALPKHHQHICCEARLPNPQGAASLSCQGGVTALPLTNRHRRIESDTTNTFTGSSKSESTYTSEKGKSVSTGSYSENRTKESIDGNPGNDSATGSAGSSRRWFSENSKHLRRGTKPAAAAVQHFKAGCEVVPEEDSSKPFSAKERPVLLSFSLSERIRLSPTCDTAPHAELAETIRRSTINCPRPFSSSAAAGLRAENAAQPACSRRAYIGKLAASHGSNGNKQLCSADSVPQAHTSKRARSLHSRRKPPLLEVFLRAGVSLEDMEINTQGRNLTVPACILQEVQEREEGAKVHLLQFCSAIQTLKRQAVKMENRCLAHLQKLQKARRAFIRGLTHLLDAGSRGGLYKALIEKLEELEFIRKMLRQNKGGESDESAVLRILRAFQEMSPGGLEAQAETVSPEMAERALLLRSEIFILERLFYKEIVAKGAEPPHDAFSAAGPLCRCETTAKKANQELLSTQKALHRLRELEDLLALRFRSAAMLYFNTLARLYIFYERVEELQQDWEAKDAVRDHLRKTCGAHAPQQRGCQSCEDNACVLDAATDSGTTGESASVAPSNHAEESTASGHSAEGPEDNVAPARTLMAATGLRYGRSHWKPGLCILGRDGIVSATTPATSAAANAGPTAVGGAVRKGAAAEAAAQATAVVCAGKVETAGGVPAAPMGRGSTPIAVEDRKVGHTKAAVLPSETGLPWETSHEADAKASPTAVIHPPGTRTASRPANPPVRATAATVLSPASAVTVPGAAAFAVSNAAESIAMCPGCDHLSELQLSGASAGKQTDKLDGACVSMQRRGINGKEIGPESGAASVDFVSCSITVPLGEQPEWEPSARPVCLHQPSSPQQQAFSIFNRRNKKRYDALSSPVGFSVVLHAKQAANEEKDRSKRTLPAWLHSKADSSAGSVGIPNEDIVRLEDVTHHCGVAALAVKGRSKMNLTAPKRANSAALGVVEGASSALMPTVLHADEAAHHVTRVPVNNPSASRQLEDRSSPARLSNLQCTGAFFPVTTVSRRGVQHSDGHNYALRSDVGSHTQCSYTLECEKSWVFSCSSNEACAGSSKATAALPGGYSGGTKSSVRHHALGGACCNTQCIFRSFPPASTCCCGKKYTAADASTIAVFSSVSQQNQTLAAPASVSSFSCNKNTSVPSSLPLPSHRHKDQCLPTSALCSSNKKNHASRLGSPPSRGSTRKEHLFTYRSRHCTSSYSMRSSTTALPLSYKSSALVDTGKRNALSVPSKACDAHQLVAEPAVFSSSRYRVVRSPFSRAFPCSFSSSGPSRSSFPSSSSSFRSSSSNASSSSIPVTYRFADNPLCTFSIASSPPTSTTQSLPPRVILCDNYDCPPTVPASLPAYCGCDQQERTECKERPTCSSSFL